MTSTSSHSTILTITFCYNSQAHPGCIQQNKPHYVTGLKTRNRVEKILRKFCKKSKLDPEIEIQNLELHRCSCNGLGARSADTLLDLGGRIRKTDLEEGDTVFVRRIDEGESDQDLETESKHAANSSQTNLDADISSSSSAKKKGEWLDPYHYRNKTIKLLGGDAFLSKNSFDLPVNYSYSQTFWIKLFHTTKISYRMTSRSERKKDGTFPLLLIQSINHCIERRRLTAPRFYARVTSKDLRAAAEMMQSQAIVQAASEDFIPSSDESEQELSSDIAPKTESQRRSLIDRISLRWNSNAWMRERLRSDLAPVSISYLDVLTPLAEMAALTRSEEPTGFPPLVRKALNEALSNDEAMSKEGKVGRITSPSGWAQNRVVKSALQILKGYLQSEAASSTLPLQASSDAKDSKKQALSEAKATFKRKLSDSTSEEEKLKVRKRYKKLKKSIKRGIKREEDS